MAYEAYGGFPGEHASKIGYFKVIQDPIIQKLIAAFEAVEPSTQQTLPISLEHVTLDAPLEQIVTVDGSSIPIPNVLRASRQMGYAKVVAQLLKLETLRRLDADPMMDLRDYAKLMSQTTHESVYGLPLAGIHFPGQTVNQSLREAIRIQFQSWTLDQTLKDLIYRVWSPRWPPLNGAPFQQCISSGCSGTVRWDARYADSVDCPKCGQRHYVVDYLALTSGLSEDRPENAILSDLRSVSEVLTLFAFIFHYYSSPTGRSILGRILFLLDGPLLLRAALSRVIEPIRDFLQTQKASGFPLYLVGVEKTGHLREFTSEIAERLGEPGDYFLPTQKFYCEQISGSSFDPATYNNRVNFGAKVAARLGPHHTVALNIPTGEFLLEPKANDLLGAREIISTLSRVLSMAHGNALIPLVLINERASIAPHTAAEPLQEFMNRVLKGEAL